MRCDALEQPPPGRLASFGVRFTVADMGNGVTRVEPNDLLTPNDACALFGTPGTECVPLPLPSHIRMCIEDAVVGVGQSLPDGWAIQARVRAVNEDTIEVVAYCKP